MQSRRAINLRSIDIRLLQHQGTHCILVPVHCRIGYVTARRNETLTG